MSEHNSNKRVIEGNLLSPLPVILVGANVNGKPNYLVIGYSCPFDFGKYIFFSLSKRRYTTIGIHENMTFSVNIPSENLAEKTRLLINHGQTQKYHHEILGYNYRMTDIYAAIGSVQLGKLDRFNSKRISNASLLNNKLKSIRDLTLPFKNDYVKHVFHQYVIKVENNFPLNRKELINILLEKGIGVAIHYPMPTYKQPLYERLGYGNSKCINAEEVCNCVLSLPVHPSVNLEDINYLFKKIRFNNNLIL